MIIETQNLVKTFQVGSEEVQALKGVNLSVKKGEFLSNGPIGIRKTTLMNIIGCLDTPSRKYYLNNKLVNELDYDILL